MRSGCCCPFELSTPGAAAPGVFRSRGASIAAHQRRNCSHGAGARNSATLPAVKDRSATRGAPMKTMLRNRASLRLARGASPRARGQPRHKLESLHRLRRSRQHAAVQQEGRRLREQDRRSDRRTLGTGVQYYWRPSFERGLMRTTIGEGNCDLWMDMASDTDGAEMTTPLYRSTFVLVYREDNGIVIKNFDDPTLKKLRIGVYQVSAIRQALAAHGVMQNTVIQYLSHNGDLVPEDQPSYSVQQVIDEKLDMAAVWGPMAGYYKAIKKAPLIIQPVNLMEDTVPLEFDMAMAMPRGRPEVKAAHREGDARQQGQDPRDPGRLRRAAGEVRRLHHRRRPAFARAVQAERAAQTQTAANDEPKVNARRSQEMAGAGRQSERGARQRGHRERYRARDVSRRARRRRRRARRRRLHRARQRGALRLRADCDAPGRTQGRSERDRSFRLDAADVRGMDGRC